MALRNLCRQHGAPDWVFDKHKTLVTKARGWLNWKGIDIPKELQGKVEAYKPDEINGTTASQSSSQSFNSDHGRLSTSDQENGIDEFDESIGDQYKRVCDEVKTQTAPVISNAQSSYSENSQNFVLKPGTEPMKEKNGTTRLGARQLGHQNDPKPCRATCSKHLMGVFTAILRTKVRQPLSTDRLKTARGMTSLVVSEEGAVYKGTENDQPILQPRGIVTPLKKANLLPKQCEVRRVEIPGKKMTRCFVNISFPQLAIRQQRIEDYIDNRHKFPATGRECVVLLFEMLAHAYVTEPERIDDDAMLQGLCVAMQNEVVFKALKVLRNLFCALSICYVIKA